MGRLDNIVQRNRQPWKARRMLSVGVRSLFLLLIVGLLLFTDWGTPPADNRPGVNVVPAKDTAVRDVKLWAPPAKK